MRKILLVLILNLFILPSVWAANTNNIYFSALNEDGVQAYKLNTNSSDGYDLLEISEQENEKYISADLNNELDLLLISKAKNKYLIGKISKSDEMTDCKSKKYSKLVFKSLLKDSEKEISIKCDKNPAKYEFTDLNLQELQTVATGQIIHQREKVKNAKISYELLAPKMYKVLMSKLDDKINVTDGTFELKGIKGADYNLRVESKGYIPKNFSLTVPEDVTVGNVELILVKSNSEEESNNLESMTGFGCSKLMPKYLLGASCQENKKLKGDASDITYWIQNFAGKITALIGVIVMILIIKNAMTIITSVGETEKITTAKKGIMWSLVGLGLTMFAYIIVKTVISLTYTG